MTPTLKIGVIPGDGVGPEVIEQGLEVLDASAEAFGFQYEKLIYPWSSEHYLSTGELMPESSLDEYRQLDAIYLGALGDPRVEERGLVERAVIMTLRMGLDLYINLRPIVLYATHLTPIKGIREDDVDIVVVRENTEDAYTGLGGIAREGSAYEVAIAEMVYTRNGVERSLRYAFDLARSRQKKRRVTLVDKSNAIRAQEIWRRVFAEVARDYPDVETDAVYVDAACMYMITDPQRFDVIATTNLFGDILTDLGAVIQGGMGSAASGNIHPGKVSMFEPIHGSAPDLAGQGVANPIGAIMALAMMLDYLGQDRAGNAIEAAVKSLLVDRRIPSLDAKSGLSTQQIGSLVVGEIERLATGLPVGQS